jgi:hypothetical protein
MGSLMPMMQQPMGSMMSPMMQQPMGSMMPMGST